MVAVAQRFFLILIFRSLRDWLTQGQNEPSIAQGVSLNLTLREWLTQEGKNELPTL
jgi:hypothetical protein